MLKWLGMVWRTYRVCVKEGRTRQRSATWGQPRVSHLQKTIDTLHRPKAGGGGGVVVGSLPQFTAILWHFSVVGFLTRRSETLKALALFFLQGAGGCYASCWHVICVAGHFSDFCPPKMSSLSGTNDSGKGKAPVECGKGQGGRQARYATRTTCADRVRQYPGERFRVKDTDAGERLWCLCRG